jgi:rubrerythrin
MFSVQEIFGLAVQIEKNGEFFYRESLNTVADSSLKSVLQWLADQELEHRKWFSRKKDELAEMVEDPALEEMGGSILRSILGDQTFSLGEADLSGIRTLRDLLDLALEFEKDTILFYEMIKPLVEKVETSAHLDKIIDEEKRHIQILAELKGP